MHFYGYFQTDVLINFSIPLRLGEAYIRKFRHGKAGSRQYKGGIPSCLDKTFYM